MPHNRLAGCLLVLAGCAGPNDDATARTVAINAARMLGDVEFLAHDSLEGRLVGSRGNRVAREYIAARYARLQLAMFGDSYFRPFVVPHGENEVQGVNVIGYVGGSSEPDRFIVITAHYDHLGVRNEEIFNGADDNGSGTAALMALAAYFAEHEPRHSIIFAAFDAEEGGLRGARAFVDQPPVQLKQIVVNLNMDMISHNDRELYVVGTHHSPFLRPFVERVVADVEISLPFGHDSPELGNDDWTNQSDHAPFHRNGIPFLYFGVEDHPDYHRPTDVFRSINPDFYEKAVNAILRVTLELDKNLEPVSVHGVGLARCTNRPRRNVCSTLREDRTDPMLRLCPRSRRRPGDQFRVAATPPAALRPRAAALPHDGPCTSL